MKKIALVLATLLVLSAALLGCAKQTAITLSGGVIQENGTYKVAATLEGGSGKASIASPVAVEVQDKAMTATIVMSSSNYDLMIVDGTEYRPEIVSGKSTFVIPVAALDAPLTIQAETTAMSTAHLIDYQIVFDPLSVQAA